METVKQMLGGLCLAATKKKTLEEITKRKTKKGRGEVLAAAYQCAARNILKKKKIEQEKRNENETN